MQIIYWIFSLVAAVKATTTLLNCLTDGSMMNCAGKTTKVSTSWTTYSSNQQRLFQMIHLRNCFALLYTSHMLWSSQLKRFKSHLSSPCSRSLPGVLRRPGCTLCRMGRRVLPRHWAWRRRGWWCLGGKHGRVWYTAKIAISLEMMRISEYHGIYWLSECDYLWEYTNYGEQNIGFACGRSLEKWQLHDMRKNEAGSTIITDVPQSQ